jgi:hypothetical protein
MLGRTISWHAPKLLLLLLLLLGTLVAMCHGHWRPADEPRGGCGPAYLCTGLYALCTSAPCGPLENGTYTCGCDVIYGERMSGVTCDQVQPVRNPDGTTTVYSQFSLVQAPTHDVMTCPAGTPWTWCLDVKCTIEPGNSTKAKCACLPPKQPDIPWITLGGNCNTKTCATANWSGASNAGFKCGIEFLRAHGDRTPVTDCPTTNAAGECGM